MMLNEGERKAWADGGFIIRRGLINAATVAQVERQIVEAIRADPPENHPAERVYSTAQDLLIYPERQPSPIARRPEDFIAKVFNCHMVGEAMALALSDAIIEPLRELLADELDCFQSQFIFKNPGVIGQPWHQDAYYFRYDRQPQVTVWVALSKATLRNGCLWVVPGSHRPHAVFEHVPDQRPESLQGYQEIVSENTASEIPVTMEPGDVLFFHSYLMHRSTDNVADYRRSAMVYHYAEAGTRPVSEAAAQTLAAVNRWLPARRNPSPIPA